MGSIKEGKDEVLSKLTQSEGMMGQGQRGEDGTAEASTYFMALRPPHPSFLPSNFCHNLFFVVVVFFSLFVPRPAGGALACPGCLSQVYVRVLILAHHRRWPILAPLQLQDPQIEAPAFVLRYLPRVQQGTER